LLLAHTQAAEPRDTSEKEEIKFIVDEKQSVGRNVTKKQAVAFLDPFVSANINSLSSSSEALDDDVGTISKAGRKTSL
jgi:hypothetical protein